MFTTKKSIQPGVSGAWSATVAEGKWEWEAVVEPHTPRGKPKCPMTAQTQQI